MSKRDWERQRLERERDRGETGRQGHPEREGEREEEAARDTKCVCESREVRQPYEGQHLTGTGRSCGCAQHPAPTPPSCPLSLGPRAGKFPGWAERGAHSWCPRAWQGWFGVRRRRGERVQETVAGGSRNEGSLSAERGEGQIPGHCAGDGGWGVGGGAKNKGAPILCLGPQTAAPSPQLPVPPTSLGITPRYAGPGRPRPAPAGPQTTGSFSAACSDLRAPDLGSVPSRVSCRDAHTAPFCVALDGGGPASEQPQPGQQRLDHLVAQQPEPQGGSLPVGLGRRAGLGLPPPPVS